MKIKATLILPDDVGDGWRKRIPTVFDHFPDLNEEIPLLNDDGTAMRTFKVTGTSSWMQKCLWRRVEKLEVYLDNAPMSWKL